MIFFLINDVTLAYSLKKSSYYKAACGLMINTKICIYAYITSMYL